MTLVCGVDSSTRSCKILIRKLESGALSRTGRAAHPDGTEVDPQAWWETLLAATSQAGGLEDVAAIAIAGQQHGLVALDANAHVIRPALLWNDTRSAQAARALSAEVGVETLARRTGSLPVASFTLTKLRRLRDQAPLGPDLGQLTIDRSEASGSGYFNPATGNYDRDLLERALGRADGIILPRSLGPSERAGATPAGAILAAGGGEIASATRQNRLLVILSGLGCFPGVSLSCIVRSSVGRL